VPGSGLPPLADDRVAAYLTRIGYAGSSSPTLTTLAGLQRAHLLAVPFENLDLHLGRRLDLDLDRVYDKVVLRRRGGWCFELNALYASLLEALGFSVTLLGGAVESDGELSEDLVHLLVRVDLERPWISDVGFGESSLEPVPLYADGERAAIENGGARVLFSLTPRRLEDFAAQCHRLQTSPDSWFVTRRTCTIARPDGRDTLSDLRLIETRAGERQERHLTGEEEWRAVLRERFGVVLDGEATVSTPGELGTRSPMGESRQPESMRPPAGEWDVVRESGLLPPGLRKRIGEDSGETQLLGYTVGAFDVAGRSLVYRRWPVRDRLRQRPDGTWEGEGLVLGVPFCRFTLRGR
jgi:N-hydroxyarylamine O-acetyltransferase